MKRRKIKTKNKFFMLILMLFISIGFAMLKADINIQGISIAKGNIWDVHFENIEVSNKSVKKTSDPVINTDKNKVNFIAILDKPGDKYEFTVDVVNDGTIDAMVDIFSNSNLNPEQANRIVYTVTYIDGVEIKSKDLLEKGKRDKLLVSVVYANLDNGDTSVINVNFSFSIDYVQATTAAKERDKNNLIEYKGNASDETLPIIVPGTQETSCINCPVQIPQEIPSNGNYSFLGWSEDKYANENSTWYDPGDYYEKTKGTVLYAQWYNLNNLENKMNSYVRAEDFEILNKTIMNNITIAGTCYCSLNEGHLDNCDNLNYNYDIRENIAGYKTLGVVGWQNQSNTAVFYRSSIRGVGIRNNSTTSISAKTDLNVLALKLRQNNSVTSGTIDEKISSIIYASQKNMQPGDFYSTKLLKENISITAKGTIAVTSKETVNAKYKFIAPSGFNFSNSSTNGGGASYASMYKYYPYINTTSNEYGITFNIFNINKNASKLKMEHSSLYAEKRTPNNYSYIPDEEKYNTKGKARYVKIKELESLSNNNSFILPTKITVKESLSTGTLKYGIDTFDGYTQSISGKKLLGVIGYEYTGPDGSGNSFVNSRAMQLRNFQMVNTSGDTFYKFDAVRNPTNLNFGVVSYPVYRAYVLVIDN